MRDADKPPASAPAPTAKLARRLRLAGAALVWERAWPALWPAVAVIGIFLALALLDIPARLPGWLHLALLALAGLLLAAALVQAARQIKLPGGAAARRRVETASGLAHRPLTTLQDHLSGGANDAASAALWQMHRARMAAELKHLRIGVPAAGLVRRDPYALRVALGLVLLIAAIDAGGDWSERLGRALAPSFAPGGPAATVSLDLWVTPPEYTGLPPQFLSAAQSQGAAPATIDVPVGSTVLAQVSGGRNPPQLKIDAAATEFSRIDEHNFKVGATIRAATRLAVEQDGRTLGTWPIRVVPDAPPTIAFAKPPERSERAALRLEYQASDDYGVEQAQATIRRPGDTTAAAITLDLPLPGQHLRQAHESGYFDLTAHPWAGLPVEIQLHAADALGQTGDSETVQTTLPERSFHNPVAKAIVEQRKQLTIDPTQRDVVAETLSDLSLRPQLFNDDKVVFLALRTAQARLVLDHGPDAVAGVQQLLWETALRIEDGRSPLAQADLRQAMKSLQDALARNAPDAEIERLMRELQQAIQKYLQALAENMQRQGDQDMPPVDPSQMLSMQDLKNMLDRARDLARTGAKDQARDLLSQLQEMLENLRMARPGQMQGGQGQQMRAMQEMMQRQQQLLDRSFRQSRRGPARQGEPQMGEGQDVQGDAAQQDALRRKLGEMMRRMGEQGDGDIPQALGRAERAMRGAGDALRQNQPGDAIEPQTQALDSLQQAAREMAERMLGRAGQQPDGSDPGDREGLRQAERDPFGRLTDQDHGNGGLDDGGRMRLGKSQSDYAIEKAKEILDELRQRAGDRSRPALERDYIDRLLKQF